jgi:hypothetical protein
MFISRVTRMTILKLCLYLVSIVVIHYSSGLLYRLGLEIGLAWHAWMWVTSAALSSTKYCCYVKGNPQNTKIH